MQSVYKNVELPIVKSFRLEKPTTLQKQKGKIAPTSNVDVVDSDDSIGSASDLRIDDDLQPATTKDDFSETISESIKTCGSSAYHAECESMATHEEDGISRMIRLKTREEAKKQNVQQNEEDMLFMGHQYGDKPLLMDDELDSDCEQTKYDTNQWNIEKNNQKVDLWIPPSSSFEDRNDVFANAPFIKKIKSKNEQQESDLKCLNPFLTPEEHVEPDLISIESPKKENLFNDSNFEAFSTQETFYTNENVNVQQYFSDFPEVKNKKDKKKSKYHLIDDNISDDSPTTSITTKNCTKIVIKSGKTKKSGRKTPQHEGGFSNMSFEDFPTDEERDTSNNTLVMPFEVVRTPEQEEKIIYSNKRNPFS